MDFLRGRIAELDVAFDRSVSANLREPLVRALLSVGSSITRADLDDKVVDLCTALESLLSVAGDGRKAQAIAVRYMLAGIAVEDDSYVTHPLEIFDLYLLRNEVVHGSARRVCGQEDYDALRYVVLDAVERLTTIIKQQPTIHRVSQIFEHIATEAALARVVTFVERYPPTSKAVREVGGLARAWLDEARTTGRVRTP